MKTKFWPIFFLLLEALGFTALLKIFLGIVRPVILTDYHYWNNILWWFSYAVFIALSAYVIRRKLGGWKWKDLGFAVHRSWLKDIRFGVIAFCVIYLLNLPFKFFILKIQADLITEADMLGHPILIIALIVFTGKMFTTGFFTGALHEEIRFRGYLQGMFTKTSWPAIGLFISLVPFAFGHYLSHPDWTLLQVFNTVIPGLIFCLAFFATGSLIVTITAHALVNLIPLYAPFMYARGNTDVAYVIIVALSVIAVIVLIIGRSDLKYLVSKSGSMFKKTGIKMSLVGIIISILFFIGGVAMNALLVQSGMGKNILFLILLAFASVCIGSAMVYWNTRRKKV